MKRVYKTPIAKVLLFHLEGALLQGSRSIEIDKEEDVNDSEKSNRRSPWESI